MNLIQNPRFVLEQRHFRLSCTLAPKAFASNRWNTLWVAMFAMASCLPLPSQAQTPSTESKTPAMRFEDHFEDKALRLELFHGGDAKESSFALRDIYEEPMWPENPHQLITPFSYGKHMVRVVDAASSQLLYSRGFDTMFAEYVTTEPAIKGVKRIFETAVRIPQPKAKVRVEITHRNKQNAWNKVFEIELDPKDYHIRRETPTTDKTFEIHMSGDPKHCVDVVFLAEGYLAEEQAKFQGDVERLTRYMFECDPYKQSKGKFNVRGVFRASQEKGTDQPRQGSYKNTALQTTYNIFDLDRYLLLEENHTMHRMAAQVPYDTIVVIVNTPRYGGGSICLDYCTSSVDHPTSNHVFLHEFGHSFAYLADEYIGNVAYNDMYPEGVEPVEPNITRELDPNKIKWKHLLDPSLTIPSTKEGWKKGMVGAFEGGGYMAKGIYRPEWMCWMGHNDPKLGFCAVCREGIQKMIDYYTQPQ